MASMEELADEAGGRAFYNTNDLSSAIREAVKDGDISYTLGFYLDAPALDGKFHELKIRVDRPGVDVRFPSGYFALKEQTTVAQWQREIHRVLVSPLESPLIHVAARVDRSDGGLRVAGAIDLRDLHLVDEGNVRTGAVEIFVIQQDALGFILDQSRRRLNLALNSEQYAAYLKSGILFKQDVVRKQGVATVRILAGDPAGANIGSLIIPLSRVK
jgi:hypothetical protein